MTASTLIAADRRAVDAYEQLRREHPVSHRWTRIRSGISAVTKRVIALAHAAGVTLRCLGTTKAGDPRHPLYLRLDARPMFFA